MQPNIILATFKIDYLLLEAVYAWSKQNFSTQKKQLFKFSLFNFGILQYRSICMVKTKFLNPKEATFKIQLVQLWNITVFRNGFL